MKIFVFFALFLTLPSSVMAAEVFTCDEPKGVAMWSSEGHKATPDSFVGVKPVVILDGDKMVIVWGDSKSAGGGAKTWEPIVFHRSPESVSAIALDADGGNSASMLYTVDIVRGYLYLSTHKESSLFNSSSAASFVAKCQHENQ